MSRGRRLLFNFEKIFNDHRKLCYLFVDDVLYKTVKEFKLHVLAGFDISESVYFSDGNGVLFPDFDDIRTLLDCSEVWVRKVKDGSSLIRNSELKDDSLSQSKVRNQNNELTSLEVTGSIGSNDVNSSSIQDCQESSEIKYICKHETTTYTRGFNEVLLDSVTNVSFNQTEKGSMCYNKSNDVNNLSDNVSENVISLDPIGVNEFEFSDSVLKDGNNKCEVEVSDLSNNNFIDEHKTKRKRKRIRKNKLKQSLNNAKATFNYSENKCMKSEEPFCDLSDSTNKHIRFESDDELYISDKNSNQISNTERSEQESEVQKVIQLNGNVKSDYTPQTESSFYKHDTNDVSVEVLQEIVPNKAFLDVNVDVETGKVINCENYSTFNINVGKANKKIKPASEKKNNWDQKDEPELFYDSLLRLKNYKMINKHFKSPVFTRTPKVDYKNKHLLWRSTKNCSPEDVTSADRNYPLDKEQSLDQNPNTADVDKNSPGNIHRPVERTTTVLNNSTSTDFIGPVQYNQNDNTEGVNRKLSELSKTMEDVSLKVDDIVNFKIIHLSQEYIPTVSDNIVGRVISATDEVLQFKILLGQEICKPLSGKFSLSENDECGKNEDIIELRLKDLINPKKIINPFSMLNNNTDNN